MANKTNSKTVLHGAENAENVERGWGGWAVLPTQTLRKNREAFHHIRACRMVGVTA